MDCTRLLSQRPSVAADVLACWHRQGGDDNRLLTGNDEHGQKILRTAVSNDTTPKEWADRLVTDAWLPLLKPINIANYGFIRTTDKPHERDVTIFLQKPCDDGIILVNTRVIAASAASNTS